MQAFKPMLCKLGTEDDLKNFSSGKCGKWLFEPKLDGARIIAVIRDGHVRLWGRSGIEKTHLFPDLKFDVKSDCVLDGEVLSGNTFNDLQHRINRVNGISENIKQYPARYSVFDIVASGDTPIARFPLLTRKEMLRGVVNETDNVKLTEWSDDGVKLFDLMKANQLEGVVGKAKDGLYHENKREWLKVKCWQEGEFLAVGYTAGTGARASTFGALVLCDIKGNYVGAVGTGFTDIMIRQLMRMFIPGPCRWAKEPEPAKWILPFSIKVKYLEYTNGGQLRFPAFKGVV